MDEQFLSPLEVAEIFQVKKNTVYEMIMQKTYLLSHLFSVKTTCIYHIYISLCIR